MNGQVTATSGGANLAGNHNSNYLRPPVKRPEVEEEEIPAEELPRAVTGSPEMRSGSYVEKQVSDAVSFSQTQQGFLSIVGNALDRMSELSELCQDYSKSDLDRATYTAEFTQLQNFISDIGGKRFNGLTLFQGAAPEIYLGGSAGSVPLQAIEINKPEATGGLADVYDGRATEVRSQQGPSAALSNIEKAFRNLGTMQAKVEANLQRLKLSDEQLSVLSENLSAANNRINDIDWAKSITQIARKKMLAQLGAAMQAQANVVPAATLRLLD